VFGAVKYFEETNACVHVFPDAHVERSLDHIVHMRIDSLSWSRSASGSSQGSAREKDNIEEDKPQIECSSILPSRPQLWGMSPKRRSLRWPLIIGGPYAQVAR
jgi:hypothetical protein